MVKEKEKTQRIWALLDEVRDPELPVVSIVELGIAREVAICNDAVEVTITPTYSGCPAMAHIAAEIQATLAAHGFSEVTVRTALAPPWTSDWLSESGRRKLKDYGIAPPGPASSAQARQWRVKCPHCGSLATETISEFGSTACKALYRCRDCREPFDYFKPL
jgi:ring-1,2-phenylacetyl-CoA epoxidase subunit PaaD